MVNFTIVAVSNATVPVLWTKALPLVKVLKITVQERIKRIKYVWFLQTLYTKNGPDRSNKWQLTILKTNM